MFWRRKQREYDLEREIRADLELETAEQRAAGLSADEARHAARRAFGNPALVQEDVRETWGWSLGAQLAQDLRYALRTIRANRAFSAAAILSLALGIGANTAIFSLMDALLLRFLPVRNPGELVELMLVEQGHSGDSFAYPPIAAMAARTDIFAGVCGFTSYSFNETSRQGTGRLTVPGSPANSTGRWAWSRSPDACSAPQTIVPARRPSPCFRTTFGRPATAAISAPSGGPSKSKTRPCRLSASAPAASKAPVSAARPMSPWRWPRCRSFFPSAAACWKPRRNGCASWRGPAGHFSGAGKSTPGGGLAADGLPRHPAAHERQAPAGAAGLVHRSGPRRSRIFGSAFAIPPPAVRPDGHHRPGAADRLR